ncbi:MAG: hypothetical protein ACI8Y6_001198, partial [Brevundimonas sp.]
MRVAAWLFGVASVLASAGAVDARAQAWVPDAFDAAPETGSNVTARLNEQQSFRVSPDAPFGPEIEMKTPLAISGEAQGIAASTRRDIWIDRQGFTDRLSLETAGRLTRADGSPLPVTLQDRAVLEPEAYDLRYVRGFRSAVGRTASGLEVSLTPHAGVGLGSEGGSAEAGATLKIGEG